MQRFSQSQKQRTGLGGGAHGSGGRLARRRQVVPRLRAYQRIGDAPLSKSGAFFVNMRASTPPSPSLCPPGTLRVLQGQLPARELILPAMKISARSSAKLQCRGKKPTPSTNHQHCFQRCTSMFRSLIRFVFRIRPPLPSMPSRRCPPPYCTPV
jgi:hypothetical protein